jgi:hypothetical protein
MGVGTTVASSGHERPLVLWLGGSPPRLLTAACLQQSLEVRGIQRDDLGIVAPYARALVLEVPPEDQDFPSWGSVLLSEAHAHGLGVALVQYEQEADLPRMEDEEAAAKFYAAVKSLRRDASRAVAMYRDWARIAKWAHDHNPGPGANPSLVVEGAFSEPSVDLLLRRAFHDLGSITLQVLSGGKSGASVWRVRPGEGDRARRVLPFVVKLHEREKMRAERSNCFIVRNAVEQRLYAQLHSERCVEGDELGLVVYDVVERAMPFRMALPALPEVLVGSLFGQTLHGFRSCAVSETCLLVPEFERGRLKALRWSDALREAAVFARAIAPTLPDVDALARMLAELRAMRVTLATVHGDLHAGNLFVPVGSTDVLMIDYGAVLQNAPAVADPACLEVSLTFPPIDSSPPDQMTRLSPEWKRAAYRYPLDIFAVRGLSVTDEWVARAVGAIRAQARNVDPSAETYGLAVASHLIRFASFDDHAHIEERALAYELACGIVQGVRAVSRAGSTSEARAADAD